MERMDEGREKEVKKNVVQVDKDRGVENRARRHWVSATRRTQTQMQTRQARLQSSKEMVTVFSRRRTGKRG